MKKILLFLFISGLFLQPTTIFCWNNKNPFTNKTEKNSLKKELEKKEEELKENNKNLETTKKELKNATSWKSKENLKKITAGVVAGVVGATGLISFILFLKNNPNK